MASDRKQWTETLVLRARKMQNRFLDRTCGDDEDLRQEVAALLAVPPASGDGPEEAEEDSADRVVVNAFLQEYLKDLADGKAHPLDFYQAKYPDRSALIARAYTEANARNGEADEEEEQSSKSRKHIGPYRRLRLLGKGGYGEVYLAEQEWPRRKVALKLIRRDRISQETLDRFEEEAELLGGLQHPGIARLINAGRALGQEGRPYIAMEYVEGETLKDLIARARSWKEGRPDKKTPGDSSSRRSSSSSSPRTRKEFFKSVHLIEKAARALHVAHEKGVIHRDVKPANIVVNPAGDPVLLDFGLARDTSGQVSGRSAEGIAPGTLSYMSPEQLSGTGDLDCRTDVWSLGVTLFEYLTGKLPFAGTTRHDREDAILHRDPADPRRLNPSSAFPDDLAVVLEVALEKDLNRRYQTALDLAEDLRRVRNHEPIAARPVSTWVKFRRWTQRYPGVAALLAVVGILLVGGLILIKIWTGQLRDEQAATSVALDELSKERARVSFSMGRLEANLGKWSTALPLYDKAISAGYPDPVEVGIYKIEALAGQQDSTGVARDLTALLEIPDPGKHRAKLLLLKGDLLAGREEGKEDIEEALALAQDEGGLSEADRAYGRALLASTVTQALEQVRSALDLDPKHRFANELLGSLLVMTMDHQALRRFVPGFRALFPEDGMALTLEAFQTCLEGDLETGREKIRSLEDRFSRSDIAFLIDFTEFLETASKIDDLAEKITFEGSNPLRKLIPLFLSGQGFRKSLRRRVLFHVPPAAIRYFEHLYSNFNRLLGYKLPEPLDKNDGFSLYLRGSVHFGDGRFEMGTEDLIAAASAGPSILTPRRLSLFQAVISQAGKYFRTKKEDQPALAWQTRSIISRLLEWQDLSSRNYEFACKVAVVMDLLDLAEYGIARWQKHFPEDPEIPGTRGRLYVKQGAYGNALPLLDRYLEHKPGEPLASQARKKAFANVGLIPFAGKLLSREDYEKARMKPR